MAHTGGYGEGVHPPLSNLPALTTARLSIRPLVAADAAVLAVLTNDAAITDAVHFLPSPFTAADAAALIAGIDPDNCFLGLWRAGVLVGVVGTHAHDPDGLEIGYWVGPDHQRQGYGYEAVSSVVTCLRQAYPQRRIVAECRPDNAVSWTLLHKLGFRAAGREGHRPGRALLVFVDGRP